MKVLIYSHGTRGDLQPYLAVAHALNGAGHTSTLVGPGMYAQFAEEYGVRYASVTDAGVQINARPDVRQVLLNSDRTGAGSLEYQKIREKIFDEVMPKVYPVMIQQMWEAAHDGADIVVHSHQSQQVIHQIAEKLGAPHVLATLYPHFVASQRYPRRLGSLDAAPDNLRQHQLAEQRPLPPMLVDMISTWRADTLGLPPRPGYLDARYQADGSPAPVIHGFSPHVVEPAADWPSWVSTTGFWNLPPLGWQPSQRLLDFLAGGEKPVFIGFSSMAGADPLDTGRLVLETVRRTGVRAVVVTGWGGIAIDDPPPEILVEPDIPYDWLFPRVRAAVHAGGPGTHNLALAAGTPQVICPFHKEQLMWGRRMHELGVAPAPIKQRDLTVDGLVTAIREALTDPEIAKAANRLAEKVRGEDGVRAAVRVLERIHQESEAGAVRQPT